MNEPGIDSYSPAESSAGGYACPDCNQWVSISMGHLCNMFSQRYGYTCLKCNQSIHGDRLREHVCSNIELSFDPIPGHVSYEVIRDLLEKILEKLNDIETALL